MPRPKTWELFDKIFYPDAKRVELSDLPKPIQGVRPAVALFDEHVRLIHREPDCLGANQCRYPEPHHHGFSCDKTCTECRGYCYPVCPANENGEKK